MPHLPDCLAVGLTVTTKVSPSSTGSKLIAFTIMSLTFSNFLITLVICMPRSFRYEVCLVTAIIAERGVYLCKMSKCKIMKELFLIGRIGNKR